MKQMIIRLNTIYVWLNEDFHFELQGEHTCIGDIADTFAFIKGIFDRRKNNEF